MCQLPDSSPPHTQCRCLHWPRFTDGDTEAQERERALRGPDRPGRHLVAGGGGDSSPSLHKSYSALQGSQQVALLGASRGQSEVALALPRLHEQMKTTGYSKHCHRGTPGMVPSQHGKVEEGFSAPAAPSVNPDEWPISIQTAAEMILHQPQRTFPPPRRDSAPTHELASPGLSHPFD